MDIGLKLPRRTVISLLLLPSMGILFITLVFPSLWALVLSFTDYTLGKKATFVGLHNYVQIFVRTEEFWDSALKTVLFTMSVVSIELMLGFLFSWLLAGRFAFQRLWISFILAPLAVSPVVAITVWKYMFTPNSGIVNYLIYLLGGTAPNWFTSRVFAFIAIGIIDVWLETPFVFTILYPSITSISSSLLEAAKIDGANAAQIATRITIPLIRPALLTTAIFRVIFALRLFSPVWLFSKGGPAGATRLLSVYLYEQGFNYWHFGLGCAIAWILLFLTMAIASPQIRIMERTMFGHTRAPGA